MLDDLDRHMTAAGDVARAMVPMGMFMAWCGHLQLVSDAFQQAHETAVLRLRYRELTPAEFFAATTHGGIDPADLNRQGRSFAQAYYPHYLDDFRSVFGADIYAVGDSWDRYDEIAPLLTKRFMKFREGGRRSRDFSDRSGAVRKWWQRWRS